MSYIESIKISSGFIEIIKPLENIAECCVSRIEYTPLNKKQIKNFELLYVREYKQVRTWNKGPFFSRSKHVLFSESVILGLFLVCSYETWFVRVMCCHQEALPYFLKVTSNSAKYRKNFKNKFLKSYIFGKTVSLHNASDYTKQ